MIIFLSFQAKLRSWKAQALWNKFDKRAAHKCYNRGKVCPNTRVSHMRLKSSNKKVLIVDARLYQSLKYHRKHLHKKIQQLRLVINIQILYKNNSKNYIPTLHAYIT